MVGHLKTAHSMLFETDFFKFRTGMVSLLFDVIHQRFFILTSSSTLEYMCKKHGRNLKKWSSSFRKDPSINTNE